MRLYVSQAKRFSCTSNLPMFLLMVINRTNRLFEPTEKPTVCHNPLQNKNLKNKLDIYSNLVPKKSPFLHIWFTRLGSQGGRVTFLRYLTCTLQVQQLLNNASATLILTIKRSSSKLVQNCHLALQTNRSICKRWPRTWASIVV